MKRLLLTLVAAIILTVSQASPCIKYKFDFEPLIGAMPGVITFSWSFNKSFNVCNTENQVITDKKFVITISTLFEDILVKDTATGPSYRFNSVGLHEDHLIVTIRELGWQGYSANSLLIRFQHAYLPTMSSTADSLNYALMNGYYYNVKTYLQNMNRTDLLNEVINQYNILYPQYSTERTRFFNHSLDTETLTLRHMAFVKGRNKFMNALNKLNPGTKESFIVYAKISQDNQLLEYRVVPETSKDHFDKASSHLQFINRTGETADAIIIIGAEKKKKSDNYYLGNERTLIDPDSEYFQTKFSRPSMVVH